MTALPPRKPAKSGKAWPTIAPATPANAAPPAGERAARRGRRRSPCAPSPRNAGQRARAAPSCSSAFQAPGLPSPVAAQVDAVAARDEQRDRDRAEQVAQQRLLRRIPPVPVASFHLTRYPRAAAPEAFSRMGLDRPVLRAHARPALLAPARHGPRADDDARAPTCAAGRCSRSGRTRRRSTRFLARLARSRRAGARSGARATRVRLAPLRWHGAWGGARPARGAARPRAARRERPGRDPDPRGDPAARGCVAFYRAIAPPARRPARRARACCASVGAGEWPVARQATFSLWRDARRRARLRLRPRPSTGRSSAGRARSAGTREELFARFRAVWFRGNVGRSGSAGERVGEGASNGTVRRHRPRRHEDPGGGGRRAARGARRVAPRRRRRRAARPTWRWRWSAPCATRPSRPGVGPGGPGRRSASARRASSTTRRARSRARATCPTGRARTRCAEKLEAALGRAGRARQRRQRRHDGRVRARRGQAVPLAARRVLGHRRRRRDRARRRAVGGPRRAPARSATWSCKSDGRTCPCGRTRLHGGLRRPRRDGGARAREGRRRREDRAVQDHGGARPHAAGQRRSGRARSSATTSSRTS